MESITKNRQTPEVLLSMVGRAYGPSEVPDRDGSIEELGHGWFNVAYRIRLRSGRLVVLKIAPPPDVAVMTYERGAMATELTALRLIADHTDVPVPSVDFADTTHELCDADYFFMPFFEGDNLGLSKDDLGQEQRSRYSRALGALNRELNGMRGTGFGPLLGPYDPSWRTCFLRMAGDVLDDGRRLQVELGYGYDAITSLIAEEQDCLDEVVVPRFVEWDLWESNVMVRDGRIVAIIDHERAVYGDPLFEAGFTGIDLPVFGDPTDFLRGYGQPPLEPGERRRRRLYTLYLVLIMIIETDYRGHTDSAQYDWARGQLVDVMALFGRGPR